MHQIWYQSKNLIMFSKYPPWVTIKSITRKKIMMPPNPSPSKTQIFKKKKKKEEEEEEEGGGG